jgi:FkbM family methyltransferase
MPKPISHYMKQLKERGIKDIIAVRWRFYVDRWRWHVLEFKRDNWLAGKLVELGGNTVSLQGIQLSVNNPLVTTRHKGTIFFGIYEMHERELTRRYIDRTLSTIEIGASIGGVACTTNKLLLDPSRHVVCECNPIVLPTLEENRKRNNCQFIIEPQAVAYGSDTVTFFIDNADFTGGNLQRTDGERVTVGATTLRQLLQKHCFSAINLICDSEGAEVDMVEHEADVIRDHVKVLIIETHEQRRGADRTAKMLATLASIGFDIKDKSEETLAMINSHI